MSKFPVVVVTLLLPALGCVTPGTQLRRRAAADFDCTPEQISAASLGAGGYRAMGCGRMATYVCTSGSAGFFCALDSEIQAIEPSATSNPDAARSELCRAVRLCGDFDVTIRYDADGVPVDVSHPPAETPTSRSCVAQAALAHRMDAGSYTCPSAEHTQPSPARVEQQGQSAAGNSHTDSGGSVSPQADGAEASARALLNAQCSAILACTSTEQAAVRLTPGEGAPRVELQGAADSPESACVASALAGVTELTELRLSRPLVHLVRCP